jgi:hypothetical protein
MVNKPNLRYRHAYAILRIDLPISDTPENSFRVVKVFFSEPDAEKEVARLTDANADKSCVYQLQVTRLVE